MTTANTVNISGISDQPPHQPSDGRLAGDGCTPLYRARGRVSRSSSGRPRAGIGIHAHYARSVSAGWVEGEQPLAPFDLPAELSWILPAVVGDQVFDMVMHQGVCLPRVALGNGPGDVSMAVRDMPPHRFPRHR